VQSKLERLQAQLTALTAAHSAAEVARHSARTSYESSRSSLELARRLTHCLHAEAAQWTSAITAAQTLHSCALGDALLAAVTVTYTGALQWSQRSALVSTQWLPFMATAVAGSPLHVSATTASRSALNLLMPEAVVAQWGVEGLVTAGQETAAAETAAIVCDSLLTPLLIDPQLQGLLWLKGRESAPDRHLSILRPTQVGQQGCDIQYHKLYSRLTLRYCMMCRYTTACTLLCNC
jgi:dynein heavy chain, axonemal